MEKSPIIDIIIPALNEENAVSRVIRDLPKDILRNIIVVDNGSTDNTAEKARQAGAIVLEEKKKGYGSACLKALEYISKEATKPDIVAFIDADYSDYPEHLTEITEPLIKKQADLVIGSRIAGNADKGSLTLPQRAGNTLACRLIRLLYGYRFTDLGPFRAVSYQALQAMKMKDHDYGWTVEMQIKAAQLGLRCTEVPVNYRRRIGVSKVSGTVKGVFMAGYKIIGLILLYSFTSWK